MSVIPLTRPVDIKSVDVTDEAARLGFKHPVTISREVWDDCCHWDDYIEATKTGYTAEETEGRLRDLLWNALLAAKRSQRARTYFTYQRVPVGTKGTQSRPVTLAVSIGPGHRWEPVIVIEFPKG